ncbi:MAG TPA: crossover junction endodeoxyribonuclease RuvC [Candidatus Saccharimonadia bacterium]|jgi:crossover junction endodeoxyribonuclease RuvC|nr:crossover junction endodeoxyribonuclease RuvC [Candidatus Saccharimonadia bacterium]
MRIIGIDPGTATTGFGVIDVDRGRFTFVDAGVITTPAHTPMPERLMTLHTELVQVIAEVRPDQAAVELLFFATNVTTAIAVGQARGVILLSLAEAGLAAAEYTPMQIKQAVTSYGGAKKPQIQEMVKLLLHLPTIPKPDDAADGLAIAITHAQSPGTIGA